MVKERSIETTQGVTGEVTVEIYDKFMRRRRDRGGWIDTKPILEVGINRGLALEIGPGPGYLGLEWLKKTDNTSLQTLEISSDMIKIAEMNAIDYNFQNRVKNIHGNALEMPFEDNMFDGVFTNGSLHEWADPIKVFNEIFRVLKLGGKYCISDLRRDINPLIKWFMRSTTKPIEMSDGLIASINASYTISELHKLLQNTKLKNYKIKKNFIGLIIQGDKIE
ncbi:MAG: class I SAM-dependent methyltransferase [Candidatus Helarchaeota archaeon]|nr:class I SAM-dependent methyltransferase [Candidatus Helarchaeota archaeon]